MIKMVVCSTAGGKKIFHSTTCRCATLINPENKRFFKSPEKARSAGYTEGSCCSKVAGFFNNERAQAKLFCEERGWKIFYKDGVVYIISDEDTGWKLIYANKSNQKFALYHENLKWHYYVRRERLPENRDYHLQKVKKNTLMGYLKYIARHEEWALKRETQFSYGKLQAVHGKRNGRKESARVKKMKKAQRRKAINYTISLIDNLTADYRIPHAAI